MILNIILWVLFGALAGFIAGKLMNSSYGFFVDVLLGIVGSIVGGFIAGLFGIDNNGFSIVSLLIAIVGACIVIFIGRLFKRA